MPPAAAPAILQIYRDFLTPGREAEYKALEEEAARICAELAFPHAHLAIESLTGPKEVWWLNAFGSEAERRQVTEDYAKKPALVAALAGITSRREGPGGSVFEAPDGTRFVFWPAGTRGESDARAAAAGPDTRVFAVRPNWGMPAPEWIAAAPEFWKDNPAARARRER